MLSFIFHFVSPPAVWSSLSRCWIVVPCGAHEPHGWCDVISSFWFFLFVGGDTLRISWIVLKAKSQQQQQKPEEEEEEQTNKQTNRASYPINTHTHTHARTHTHTHTLTHRGAGNNSRRCCTVPAVRSLFSIGSCSKFWTDRGTSNVSSAANANALWPRSASLERGSCTVRMTSLGKHQKEKEKKKKQRKKEMCVVYYMFVRKYKIHGICQLKVSFKTI